MAITVLRDMGYKLDVIWLVYHNFYTVIFEFSHIFNCVVKNEINICGLVFEINSNC